VHNSLSISHHETVTSSIGYANIYLRAVFGDRAAVVCRGLYVDDMAASIVAYNDAVGLLPVLQKFQRPIAAPQHTQHPTRQGNIGHRNDGGIFIYHILLRSKTDQHMGRIIHTTYICNTHVVKYN
jgi:hypothetical protein